MAASPDRHATGGMLQPTTEMDSTQFAFLSQSAALCVAAVSTLSLHCQLSRPIKVWLKGEERW